MLRALARSPTGSALDSQATVFLEVAPGVIFGRDKLGGAGFLPGELSSLTLGLRVAVNATAAGKIIFR